jgi:hypothetical protein
MFDLRHGRCDRSTNSTATARSGVAEETPNSFSARGWHQRLLNVADRDAQPAGTSRDCAAAHEDR